MKHFRKATVWLAVVFCITIAGCRAASNSPVASEIAGYEVQMSPGVTRSIAEPALRAAVADSVVSAQVQRSGLVRVERVADKAPTRAVRLEFQNYMSGHVVELTNSMAGWRVASIGRMIE